MDSIVECDVCNDGIHYHRTEGGCEAPFRLCDCTLSKADVLERAVYAARTRPWSNSDPDIAEQIYD